MKLGHILHSFYLTLISIWWGWTVLVDMFVVRIVFSMVDDVFQAGKIGMELFTRLNQLEIVVSSALVVITFFQVKKIKNLRIEFFLSVFIWIIPMVYFCYLTPKITYLSELWQRLDLMGIYSVHGIPDIQQEHQFYHNLYIGLDTIKLITMTLMMTLAFWRRGKWE